MKREQSYNIINLEDKLKTIGGTPNYPKKKSGKLQLRLDTIVDYNIINGSPSKYLYNNANFTLKNSITKKKLANKINDRNYDILTNKYLEDNEDKSKVDRIMEKDDAAKKYWKTNIYDPISGQYYDPKKEAEFLK